MQTWQREPAQSQPTQNEREQRLKMMIDRQNGTLLKAIAILNSNLDIISKCDIAIGAIESKSKVTADGRTSPSDLEKIANERERKRLWENLTLEKMEGCRNIIQTMDRLGEELLKFRPMTAEERRIGYKTTGLYLEVSQDQRLAAGARPRVVKKIGQAHSGKIGGVSGSWR